MEPLNDASLHRTSSQTSHSSGRKHSTVRVRPRKHSSNTSLQSSTLSSQKSLTSFPSLSPTLDSPPIPSELSLAPNTISTTETTADATKEVPSAESSTIRKVSKASRSLVGSLVATPSSENNRNALFDDTPKYARVVPGNTHYTDDEHIQKMIDRTGAIPLIRQFANDLAERDAQITALRRKTEERERILRKMLLACEVSNLDIETRLRTLEKSQVVSDPLRMKGDLESDSTHLDDDIDKRLMRAMEDDISECSENLSLHEDLSFAVSQALSSTRRDEEQATQPAGARTWKSYVWTGTTKKGSKAPSLISDSDATGTRDRSRANSGSQPARKALRQDLFTPLGHVNDLGKAVPNLRRLQSQDIGRSSSERRQANTMTSWALKLVGGVQAGKETDKAKTVKVKSSTPSLQRPGGARTVSTGSAASVSKVASVSAPRGRATRSSLGPNGTIRGKGVSPDSLRTSNLASPSPNGNLRRGASNLGPVEMDTILPEDSRPPTLMAHHNNIGASQEFLTDRFGFIYDQRRKKRQSEAAAALRKHKRGSNVESLRDVRVTLEEEEDERKVAHRQDTESYERPSSTHSTEDLNAVSGKRWQDFLKLATFPTELLSHTPSTAPITAVEATEIETSHRPSNVKVDKRGSVPALSINPEPSPSRISSSNAEFATSQLSTSPAVSSPVNPMPNKQQPDPVKALLEQLTELHDSLQRDKTVRWNEFLRKVRAERKREGEVNNENRAKGLTMPEALLMDGEIVGVASLGNKGKVGRAKWQEFRELVLSGIPVTYRAKIWAECSGASELRVPGYYEDLVKNGVDDPVIASQIQMDITRTLTDNIFFRKGPGVQKLNEVLLAYSRRNTEVGYCQGMNLITASLLLIMPTAEDAFWVLASMIENILPNNYYDHSLLTSRADQVVLRSYVTEMLPKLSNHLDDLGIELEALTFQWFLSVFTDCLSAEALFRVWDVVLCMHDGSTFMFQIALALLKLNERQLLDCDNPATIYHYINHQMTNHAISIDGLIQASDALKKVVKRKDVEERRARAVERELEIMQQRDELRRQRSISKPQRKPSSHDSEEDRSRQAALTEALTQSFSHESSPVRSASSTRSYQDDDQESVDDLQQRTPMPIDEEATWRA
ncbi:TBC-domain-containing protein [Pseudovirgaria hyperparasitica]|uniref:TBC-domain-containing protein n=1 Tax=Pseudovirgaria hyperparasitica TaxID=470096 RepID=A0A6A6WIM7_9PEZI|nr:TBC-domain-containing protein [Pseudovirgaria hyperparasitica]KAF2761964.1 TBC-domain-containing protein [Pseudovirgaria hyperparasitica]